MTAELGAGVPVLLALAPLRGFDEAEFLAHEVPGVTIQVRQALGIRACR